MLGFNTVDFIKLSATVVGGTLTALLGGWDMLLQALVFLVVCDYVIGVIAAALNKEINSSIGYVGILKKILIFIVIGVCYTLDQALGSEFIRSMAIWFYLGNEGISIAENCGKAGVPIPPFLKDVLEQVHKRGTEGNGKGGVIR